MGLLSGGLEPPQDPFWSIRLPCQSHLADGGVSRWPLWPSEWAPLGLHQSREKSPESWQMQADGRVACPGQTKIVRCDMVLQ